MIQRIFFVSTYLFIFLGFFSLVSCGGDGGSTPNTDTTSPWANVDPASGNVIHDLSRIRLAFDEPMDTTNLTVAGSMSSDAYMTAWSDGNGTIVDNYLVITPTTVWTAGAGSTLEITTADVAGNPWQATLSYDISTCLNFGPVPEICDGQDNDCDGQVDEEGICVSCFPTPEICDNCDNDCDGLIDNPPAAGFPGLCDPAQVAPVVGGCL